MAKKRRAERTDDISPRDLYEAMERVADNLYGEDELPAPVMDFLRQLGDDIGMDLSTV